MTKQFWTLEHVTKEQSIDDILSPCLRYPLVNERRQHVFKNKEPQFAPVLDINGNPVINPDHTDFLNWLSILNRKGKKDSLPATPNKRTVKLFLIAHPEYNKKRAFRQKKQVA